MLTDPAGRPVAVRVVPGDTADPVAFNDIVEVIRDRFGLTRLVLIGDRGMITSARIDALRKLNDNPDTATAFGWITALRAPDIATLAAEQGPLQMSLFDTQDLAEISHPDYPGERLITCRNPALAAERARKRTELLAATDADLAAIAARVAAGRLRGAGKIGEAIGRIIVKRKVGKHFRRDITDTTFTYHRDQAGIDAEAALDGIYVLRTSVPATELDPAAVVESYKNLAHVERDFRSIKTPACRTVTSCERRRRRRCGAGARAVSPEPGPRRAGRPRVRKVRPSRGHLSRRAARSRVRRAGIPRPGPLDPRWPRGRCRVAAAVVLLRRLNLGRQPLLCRLHRPLPARRMTDRLRRLGPPAWPVASVNRTAPIRGSTLPRRR